MTGIYGLKNKENGKWYVGQAVDIAKRWQEHKKPRSAKNNAGLKLQRAFAKHGYDGFEWFVLEECDEAQLDNREQFWIAKKDSFKNGYNMTLGGGGRRGYTLSTETRAKIGAANSAYWTVHEKHIPLEVREKISKSNKGKRTGMRASEETKSKMSQARKGRKFTPEHCAAISAATRNKKSKPVRCIDTGVVYPGLREATRQTGAPTECISRCCKGKQKHAGGLRWEYA